MPATLDRKATCNPSKSLGIDLFMSSTLNAKRAINIPTKVKNIPKLVR